MSDSDSSDDYYGPALPPGFKQNTSTASESEKANEKAPVKKKEDVHIGPTLPPELRARLEANAESNSGVATKDEEDGEDCPVHKSEDDKESGSESDSDVIGPLPPDHPKAMLHQAAGNSSGSTSDSKKMKREEWMLIPPKNKIIPGLGLGPRKFLTRTPQDSRNSDEEEDEEAAFAREADAEIERKLIDDYDQKMDEMKKDFEAKKRRGESLLEIHQKDMKKKKNESSAEKAERKPFDRDTDLKISGLSQESKQKYIEKSKELNTKFSRGSRKYL